MRLFRYIYNANIVSYFIKNTTTDKYTAIPIG